MTIPQEDANIQRNRFDSAKIYQILNEWIPTPKEM